VDWVAWIHAIVQISICWCFCLCCDFQNAIKHHHRPESAVESEYKFVQVCLQVLRADSVVSSQQPSIQISENYVNHRQVGFGLRLVALDGQRIMTVAELGQVVIDGPTIEPLSSHQSIQGKTSCQGLFPFSSSVSVTRFFGNIGTGLRSAKRCRMPRIGCRSSIRGPAQRITILIFSRMSLV